MKSKLDIYLSSKAEQNASEIWIDLITNQKCNGYMKNEFVIDDGVLPSDLASVNNLGISQVCGSSVLIDLHVLKVLGIPTYNAVGCREHFMRSAVIVKSDSDILSLDNLRNKAFSIAVNNRCSVSGNLVLAGTLGSDLLSQSTIVPTGSHDQSIIAVSEGKADIAAIDCISLALFTKHQPDLLKDIRVIGYTLATPNCPYVTSRGHSDDVYTALQNAIVSATNNMSEIVRDNLLLDSFATSVDSLPDSDHNDLTTEKKVSSDSQFVEFYSTYVRGLQKLALLPSRYVLYQHDSPLEDLSSILNESSADSNETHSSVVTAIEAPDKEELETLKSSDSEFINCLMSAIHNDVSISDDDYVNIASTKQESKWSSYQHNGKAHMVRILFPGGKHAAKSFYTEKENQLLSASVATDTKVTPINIVCFMGKRLATHQASVNDIDVVRDCWEADAGIVNRLNSKVIVAYATGEVQPGGDWGNVVVFHEGHSAESNLMLSVETSSSSDVITNNAETSDKSSCPHATSALNEAVDASVVIKSKCPHSPSSGDSGYTPLNHNVHKLAIQDVSPWYYDTVRIHRASLSPHTSAIADESTYDVTYNRTLSLRYTRSYVDINDTTDRLANSQYSSVTDDGRYKSTVLTSRKVITW